MNLTRKAKDNMEKNINEVLDTVQIPNVSKEDSNEELILKFIEYIKNVERARGLTEEQIIAKYTNGCCGDLEEAITDFLKAKGIDSQTKRISCKIPNNNLGRKDSPHYLVQISDTPESYSYYDIIGKHDSQFLIHFAKKFYIENPEYQRIVAQMTDYQMDSTVPEEAFYRVYSQMQKVPQKSFTEMYNEYMEQNGAGHSKKISPEEIKEYSSKIEIGIQEINGVTQETRGIITQETIRTNNGVSK